jgi:hypothetical protein
VDDRAHEFVGVEAAFHQRLDLAIARERYALRRGRVAMLRRHELVAGKIELGLFRCGSNFGLGSDENGDDEPFLGGFNRAEQRHSVDRVDHRCTDRRQPTCFLDELSVVTPFHLSSLVRNNEFNPE